MARRNEILSLELIDLVEEPSDGGAERVRLQTDAGIVECRAHFAASAGDAAILWVFGAGGGLGGPAGGVYEGLGRRFHERGVTSLQLDYRHPGRLDACVLDVVLGVGYLGTRGATRIVLVGHSFGGAVVITAGAASEAVVAVAALSSQTYGAAGAVGALSPKPLLLIHGEADEVLPAACSRDLYAHAGEPKRSSCTRAAAMDWTSVARNSTETWADGWSRR